MGSNKNSNVLTVPSDDVQGKNVAYHDVVIIGREDADKREEVVEVRFDVDGVPPWYMCIILACQHYIAMFVTAFIVPFIVADAMCLSLNNPAFNDVVNTLYFISGITTLLQASIGIRLGIIQAASYSFLLPMIAMLSQPKWSCPTEEEYNQTLGLNNTIPYDDIWKPRMQEVSGTLMIASVFQILLGLSGGLEVMLRFIGPITIAPVIAIIGLALFENAADKCAEQWGISMLTIFLITIFVLMMRKVMVPYLPCGTPECCTKSTTDDSKANSAKDIVSLKLPVFNTFSFLFSMLLVWLLCYILTITEVFGATPAEMGYRARTDLRVDALKGTPWFRVPTPFQFGLPSVSASGILGMIAATIASVIESIGDYYAAARVSGAPPPPVHAINRGIFMEGVGCMLSGMFGAAVGSTSYSPNIAIMGITKVGSRRVVQFCGVLTIILALLGKFAALFSTIPTPVVGGIFIVLFGMIAMVGLSNLYFADIRSPRNMYILGISLLMGLSIPAFLNRNPGYIQSGYPILDEICTVLLSTGMFVAGVLAFAMDNLSPGTPEERGITVWNEIDETKDSDVTTSVKCYDIPFIDKLLKCCSCTRYIPVCNNYTGCCRCTRNKQDSGKQDLNWEVENNTHF